ncbi:MAG TPA: HlyD family efflux transporter periplasmic adaptor subunit [Terriglobales bacterium]|nr:HlyD family efflux transporter periplasmic adaptor subunit [Terriglobales bacterium]
MAHGKIRRIVLTAIVVLVLAGAVVFFFRPAALLVETAQATRGPMEVTVNEQGETRVHDRFVVSSPVTGRLMRVDLQDGDAVQQNEVVARIEPVPLSRREREEVYARVQAAEAALRQAKAREAHARKDLAQIRRDRDRAEQLAKNGVISAQVLEQARNADLTAKDELNAAESSVQQAISEEKIARAGLLGTDVSGNPPLIELHSPIQGRVLRVMEKSERVVSMGAPIVILGDSKKIEIVTEVLSTDAVKIHPGDSVWIDGWGGDHPLRARVRLVEPYGFTKISALGVEEQRVNIISDFVEAQEALGDGYRVETHVIIWSSQDVLRVPISTVFRRGQGWSVFVVTDNRARVKDVEIGHRNESEAEILSGLREGEQLVDHPPSEISDGMRVRTR